MATKRHADAYLASLKGEVEKLRRGDPYCTGTPFADWFAWAAAYSRMRRTGAPVEATRHVAIAANAARRRYEALGVQLAPAEFHAAVARITAKGLSGKVSAKKPDQGEPDRPKDGNG